MLLKVRLHNSESARAGFVRCGSIASRMYT